MRSPATTKQMILDAAEGLFARYGFRKTSIDDIAESAKIGKGSVYLHFASKEEIFAEMVRRLSEEMIETLEVAVKAASSPADEVRAFVVTRLTRLVELGAKLQLREDTLMEMLPLANSVRETYIARERALLERILLSGVEAKAFSVDDPKRLAAAIIASLMALEVTVFAQSDHIDERRKELDELLEVLLRGLCAQPTLTKA